MRAVILKTNLPLDGSRRRVLAGARIRVSDADYARLVPRLAHDAEEYLAAEAEKSERFAKENPELVKAFEVAQELRRERMRQAKEAAERMAKETKATVGRREAARKKVKAEREARAKKAALAKAKAEAKAEAEASNG